MEVSSKGKNSILKEKIHSFNRSFLGRACLRTQRGSHKTLFSFVKKGNQNMDLYSYTSESHINMAVLVVWIDQPKLGMSGWVTFSAWVSY